MLRITIQRPTLKFVLEAVIAALLLWYSFAYLTGCSSSRPVVVRNTIMYDIVPLDHALHVYEINLMLNDSALSDMQIFSLAPVNGFWYRDSSQQVQFAYYIMDVTGREFYLPKDAVMAIKVSEYKLSDTDLEVYFGKCRDMEKYYIDMK